MIAWREDFARYFKSKGLIGIPGKVRLVIEKRKSKPKRRNYLLKNRERDFN